MSPFVHFSSPANEDAVYEEPCFSSQLFFFFCLFFQKLWLKFTSFQKVAKLRRAGCRTWGKGDGSTEQNESSLVAITLRKGNKWKSDEGPRQERGRSKERLWLEEENVTETSQIEEGNLS